MEPEKPNPQETKQLTTTTGDEQKPGLMEKVREVKVQAVEEAKALKGPQETEDWKSIFRVSHDRSAPRKRS